MREKKDRLLRRPRTIIGNVNANLDRVALGRVVRRHPKIAEAKAPVGEALAKGE